MIAGPLMQRTTVRSLRAVSIKPRVFIAREEER